MNEQASPQPSPSSGWQAPAPWELDAVLSGYEVTALLGRGGMGAVYRAVQPTLDRDVAIKILPLELTAGGTGHHFSDRFKQEARSMARLSHPGIVQVHDFGEAEAAGGKFLYFVMEFVEGRNILQYLREEGGRLAPEHAHAIVCHVLDALGFAHQHGVVHRDIKPANILLDQYGRVKVADFGLAKSTSQETELTASNMAMGTPDFIAPEALETGREVDGRADLYSVGAMLYQLLTGKVPRGVFQPASELVPGLDARYDAIVTRALRHDRDARYQDSAEFRADLDRITTEPTPVLKLGIGTIPLVQPGQDGSIHEMETTPLPVSSPKPPPDSKPEPLFVAGLEPAEKERPSVLRKLLVVGFIAGLLAAGAYVFLPRADDGDGGEALAAAGGGSPAGEGGPRDPRPAAAAPVAAMAGTGGSPGAPGEPARGGEQSLLPSGLEEILDAHLSTRRGRVGELAEQYGRALERGLDRAADAGELRLTSAYRDERSRLVALMRALDADAGDLAASVEEPPGLSPLPSGCPRELADLRQTWSSEIGRIEESLAGSLRRELLELEDRLAGSRKDEMAGKVAAFRRRLGAASGSADESR